MEKQEQWICSKDGMSVEQGAQSVDGMGLRQNCSGLPGSASAGRNVRSVMLSGRLVEMYRIAHRRFCTMECMQLVGSDIDMEQSVE